MTSAHRPTVGRFFVRPPPRVMMGSLTFRDHINKDSVMRLPLSGLGVLLLSGLMLVAMPATAEQIGFRGALRAGDDQLDNTGEYFDEYALELKEGQFVDIAMESDTIDSYLIIVAPDGEQLDNDDYYTNDPTARLIFVARATGSYRILATSFQAGEVGSYQIEGWADNTREDQAIEGALDEDDTISWKGGEYYDSYTLAMRPGEQRVVNLYSDEFETFLTIYTPEGEVVAIHTYPSIYVVDSVQGGDYTVIVTSLNTAEVGSYELNYYEILEDEEQ